MQRTPGGRGEAREVPLSEYRALRWSVGTLPPKESRTVAARMRVTPLAPVAAVSH
jgi:hypothetical protein